VGREITFFTSFVFANPIPGDAEMIAVTAEDHQQVEQQLLAVLMHNRPTVV
jgi:hypothetical protein